MKKMSFFLVVVLFLTATNPGFSLSAGISDGVVAETEGTVEVHIELVDIHGDPVSGNIMVDNFYAIDQETGNRYDADRDGVFHIPAGTYRFDAGRTGPWEGVVPKVMTIEDGGTVVVELTHWYE